MLVKVTPGLVRSPSEIISIEVFPKDKPLTANFSRMIRDAAVGACDVVSGLKLQPGRPIRLTVSPHFGPLVEPVALALAWGHGARSGQLVFDFGPRQYVCGDVARVVVTDPRTGKKVLLSNRVGGRPLGGDASPLDHAAAAVGQLPPARKCTIIRGGGQQLPVEVATAWLLGATAPTMDAFLEYRSGRLTFGASDFTRIGEFVECNSPTTSEGSSVKPV